jgi:hypothetical protein
MTTLMAIDVAGTICLICGLALATVIAIDLVWSRRNRYRQGRQSYICGVCARGQTYGAPQKRGPQAFVHRFDLLTLPRDAISKTAMHDVAVTQEGAATNMF